MSEAISHESGLDAINHMSLDVKQYDDDADSRSWDFCFVGEIHQDLYLLVEILESTGFTLKSLSVHPSGRKNVLYCLSVNKFDVKNFESMISLSNKLILMIEKFESIEYVGSEAVS